MISAIINFRSVKRPVDSFVLMFNSFNQNNTSILLRDTEGLRSRILHEQRSAVSTAFQSEGVPLSVCCSKSLCSRTSSSESFSSISSATPPFITGGKMFTAACHQFVNSVGKRTLLPVPSLDEKDNVKPLQLVVKVTKRKFIFFEKAVFRPTEFQLSDVLMDNSAINVPSEEEEISSGYTRTTDFALKGKFGVDLIHDLMDVDLSTSDSVSIKIDFGKVMKTELDKSKLLLMLSKRKLNLKHPFIQQVRENKKKTLCIVTGVTYLDGEGKLSRDSKLEGTADVKVKAMKETNIGGEVDYDQDKELGLPKHTPVAYNINELMVGTTDGAIQLVLASGLHGGFSEVIGFDEIDATSAPVCESTPSQVGQEELAKEIHRPDEIFQPFLSLPTSSRQDLTTVLLQLMSVPRDVTILADIIEKIELHVQVKVSIKALEKKFISPKDTWLHILERAGFSAKDDGDLVPPGEVTPFVEAYGELFDALTELDDEVLDLIRMCSPTTAPDLVLVLQDGLKNKTVKSDSVKKIFDDSAAQKLLLQLEYQLGKEEIVPAKDLPLHLDEVYWVVFALWGQV